MIKILCLISLCFTVLGQSKIIKTRPELKYYLKRYSQKMLIENLRNFVRVSSPSRLVGSTGHKKAVDFLLAEIKPKNKQDESLTVETFKPDMNWARSVYEKDFQDKIANKYPKRHSLYRKWREFTDGAIRSFDQFKNVSGKNIIWQKDGTDPKAPILIIGAHYDNIVRDPQNFKVQPNVKSEGANDNGSAVAICLGLIKILQNLEIKNTVRVIFFDYEEMGFLGSKAYADKHLTKKALKTIYAMINLEMLGQDSIYFDKKNKLGNMHAYIRKRGELGSKKDLSLARKMIGIGSSVNNKVKFEVKQNSWNRSDHIHFWDKGIAAMTFTQNWDDDFDPNTYHGPNDIVEALNFNTLYNSFQFISGAITAWALKI